MTDEQKTERPFVRGGDFMFDIPDITPAVWGEGSDVLWAEGEALIIAGPSGVGKTTLVGQLVRGLIGLGGDVLGYPLKQCTRVLYLAMDRPAQIGRSLRRHFTPDQRDAVNERLTIWRGPPPADIAKNPALLRQLCLDAGANVVIVDSLKDAAIGLSEDAVGAGYNSARQLALAAGIEVIELHHQVKRGSNGDNPNTLADVYGSTWLTGGAGSVILLWGQAGDSIIGFSHLKQPGEPVGPFQIVHDHARGETTIWHAADPIAMLIASRGQGITVGDYASALFETDKPTPNEIEKARRRLTKLETVGKITSKEIVGGASGKPAKVFHLLKSRTPNRITNQITEPLFVNESRTANQITHPTETKGSRPTK